MNYKKIEKFLLNSGWEITGGQDMGFVQFRKGDYSLTVDSMKAVLSHKDGMALMGSTEALNKRMLMGMYLGVSFEVGDLPEKARPEMMETHIKMFKRSNDELNKRMYGG